MIFRKGEEVKLVVHDFTNPAFNLACEEYFLKQGKGSYILLWRNEPSIIIGVNQNAYAELNMDYVEKNRIPIIRRQTGGGAVFHDLGNLNFTFITEGVEGLADFKVFLEPVTDYLRSLGLDASFSGRNDILIDGMKVSGNAQAKYKQRTIFHGTMLFSVSLNVLSKALKPNPLKLKAKGISSVISRVTNIKDRLEKDMDIGAFTKGLQNHFMQTASCRAYSLSDEDLLAIRLLVKDKYSRWEWNIGHAPAYSMESSALLSGGTVSLSFNVSKGLISDIKITGDFFGMSDIGILEEKIKGTPHKQQDLLNLLEGPHIEFSDFIANTRALDFVDMFFN
ncbi:MAG: lipoate--protein ligase [Clostridiales bacterium]|nr:lipoate--protein ligase [Clostridiales bacterium]